MSAAVDEDALRRCPAAISQGRAGEAEHIAREVLTRSPRHVGGLFFLGAALLAQRRAGEAIAPLETAARIEADAAIEMHLAIALRNTGQSDAADLVRARHHAAAGVRARLHGVRRDTARHAPA